MLHQEMAHRPENGGRNEYPEEKTPHHHGAEMGAAAGANDRFGPHHLAAGWTLAQHHKMFSSERILYQKIARELTLRLVSVSPVCKIQN
jgi:hypothetical protein